jgi:uncharacterized protein involved in exopolysaccharide biosynthesis
LTHVQREFEEQEVDLASAWERIKLRWWLPVGGLVAGAIMGVALAVSGGTVWRAETLLYLGQPFAPLGGGQIQSLATNPRTVSEIVRSEAALQAASRASGIRVAQLRSSISTQEIIAPGVARTNTPLFEIAIKGPTKGKAESATKALADRVVARVSQFVTKKVDDLQNQRNIARAQLAAVEARIQTAQRQQDQIINNSSLPLETRLLLSFNLNSVITTADARRSSLQEDVYEADQLLNLAENVEKSRVVEPAAGTKTTARSRRNSLLVGALLGLLIGGVAALAAEPVLARRRASLAAG